MLPQRCLLASFEATLDLLAHNNISQIFYCGQNSLQCAAVNCIFLDPLGSGIYFAGDSTYI